MTVKELIVLAHFLKNRYGEDCEILVDLEDKSVAFNGGFRVEDQADNRKVVVLL